MAMEPNAHACGLSWYIRPLRIDEQFEAECIVLKLGASPASFAAAALVHGLAPIVVELLRDAVPKLEDPWKELLDAAPEIDAVAADAVDAEPSLAKPLEKLLDALGRIVRDVVPQLRSPWERLLDGLGQTAGDVVREAVPALAEHLDHRMLQRLFEMLVIGKAYVYLPDGPVAIASYEALSPLLRRPGAKYELLGAAWMVTYGSPDEDSEADDGDASEADGGGGE